MNRDPSDDGEVDVDAAWAEIVANWDSAPAPERADPPRPADGAQGEPADPAGTEGTQGAEGTVGDNGGATSQPGRPGPESRRAEENQPTRRTGRHLGPESHGPHSAEPEQGRVAGGLSWDEIRINDEFDDLADLHQLAELDEADLGDRGGGAPAAGPGTGPRDVARDGPSLIDGLEGDDELDEYVMPEPPRLPRPTLVSALAWLGALGAPVLLLLAALFWRTAPTLVIGCAVLAFVAGFVTLVVRMPQRDEDDDGAVV